MTVMIAGGGIVRFVIEDLNKQDTTIKVFDR